VPVVETGRAAAARTGCRAGKEGPGISRAVLPGPDIGIPAQAARRMGFGADPGRQIIAL
jgi:hypothetical protein